MRKILGLMLSISTHLRQRMGLLVALFLGMQLFLIAPAMAVYVSEVPNITADSNNWVADEAEIMSPITRRTVNQTLASIAEATGTEVRMVTIRGLNYGDSSQKFTDDLFADWFPADSLQANQVLVMLDAKTKTSGIRVGDQAETVLTPELAKSIANESLLIPVRSNNYNQAFESTANRLAALLTGEEDPGAPPETAATERERNYKTAEETNDFNATILVVVMLIIATVVPMVTYYYYQSN